MPLVFRPPVPYKGSVKAALAEPAVAKLEHGINLLAKTPYENDEPVAAGNWDECEPYDPRQPNFGIAFGNWSGYGEDPNLQDSVLSDIMTDIMTNPAQVICLQDASVDLCDRLRDQPLQRFLVVRGEDGGTTTAVAVKRHWFKAVRRDKFVLQDAGTYSVSSEVGHISRTKTFNRLMFCTLKCKSTYFENGGCRSDEIGIVNAHMTYGCATKTNSEGGSHYKRFWDELVEGIVGFSSRVLCIDASLALWCVAPELRARGLMISMAAFFPFYQLPDQQKAKVDSLGIFVIGPTLSIRMAFCPTVVEANTLPLRRSEDRLAKKQIDKGNGTPSERVKFDLIEFQNPHFGQGDYINSYMPHTINGRMRRGSFNLRALLSMRGMTKQIRNIMRKATNYICLDQNALGQIVF